MIIILLILLILVAGLPWTNSSVSNLAIKASLTRLSSVTIIFSSFLIMNIFYINQLHDGLSIFSGFFYLSAINQSFQILLLIIGGLILASVVSNRYLLLSSVNGIETLSLNKYFSLATHLASRVQLLLNNNSIKHKEGSLMFTPNQDNYIINNNYALIIIFNLLGACFLINTSDLLTLYIAVETQSFALYILSTLKNDSVNSASAGLKYFLIGSLASTLILLGIALLYYATGLTNFESMHVYLNITDFCSHGYYKGGYYEKSPYDDIMYF
jgi:NADH-ubiquinone oxidoreductase chain 2